MRERPVLKKKWPRVIITDEMKATPHGAGYKDAEHGNLKISRTIAIPHPYALCGDFGGKNKMGVACGNSAGKRTAHVGIGHCFFHHGRKEVITAKTYRQALSRNVKIPGLQELTDKLAEDRDIFDLRDHIHLLEAIGLKVLNNGNLTDAAKVLVDVTKAIERLHEIEVGRRYVVTVYDVSALMDQFVQIVERNVTDQFTRDLIAREMGGLKFDSSGNPASQVKRLAAAVIDGEHDAT